MEGLSVEFRISQQTSIILKMFNPNCFPFFAPSSTVLNLVLVCIVASGCLSGIRENTDEKPQSLMRVVDINKGEAATVGLSNGANVRLELMDRREVHDTVRGAVRLAQVRIKVNGQQAQLECGCYRLPITVGSVQVDCPVTKGLLGNTRSDPWGLEKDARLRLWPGASPFMPPGSYVYPVKQRWFATDTQMSNEPSYVDGSESPSVQKIYYHYGLDIGGAEKLTEVVSATAGVIVVLGNTALPEYQKSPYTELNYDGVIVLDKRGWFHWYFHLSSIDDGVRLGKAIGMGERIGFIGKEGNAGCWSHLHYEIRAPQPSGKPGIVEGYAFLWEAYQRAMSPEVIAVAHRDTRATGLPLPDQGHCRRGLDLRSIYRVLRRPHAGQNPEWRGRRWR